uniref:Uncharacterized protein n=1 Tax=Palpitomonas bilix TaxID=652834 RepID=A0A7S3CVE6_9EUKA
MGEAVSDQASAFSFIGEALQEAQHNKADESSTSAIGASSAAIAQQERMSGAMMGDSSVFLPGQGGHGGLKQQKKEKKNPFGGFGKKMKTLFSSKSSAHASTSSTVSVDDLLGGPMPATTSTSASSSEIQSQLKSGEGAQSGYMPFASVMSVHSGGMSEDEEAKSPTVGPAASESEGLPPPQMRRRGTIKERFSSFVEKTNRKFDAALFKTVEGSKKFGASIKKTFSKKEREGDDMSDTVSADGSEASISRAQSSFKKFKQKLANIGRKKKGGGNGTLLDGGDEVVVGTPPSIDESDSANVDGRQRNVSGSLKIPKEVWQSVAKNGEGEADIMVISATEWTEEIDRRDREIIELRKVCAEMESNFKSLSSTHERASDQQAAYERTLVECQTLMEENRSLSRHLTVQNEEMEVLRDTLSKLRSQQIGKEGEGAAAGTSSISEEEFETLKLRLKRTEEELAEEKEQYREAESLFEKASEELQLKVKAQMEELSTKNEELIEELDRYGVGLNTLSEVVEFKNGQLQALQQFIDEQGIEITDAQREAFFAEPPGVDDEEAEE